MEREESAERLDLRRRQAEEARRQKKSEEDLKENELQKEMWKEREK